MAFVTLNDAKSCLVEAIKRTLKSCHNVVVVVVLLL